MVHIPNPESVERYLNHKPSTAIKTVRLQPQLNLVHIPDPEYTQLPSLQLPSEICISSSKISSSETSQKIIYIFQTFQITPLTICHHKNLQVHVLFHTIDIISETFLTPISTDTSTINLSALPSNSALRLARQHAKPLSDTHPSELVPQSN